MTPTPSCPVLTPLPQIAPCYLFISSSSLLGRPPLSPTDTFTCFFITLSGTASLGWPVCRSAHTGDGVKFMVFAFETVSHFPFTCPLIPWLIPNSMDLLHNKWWTCLFWPKQEEHCKRNAVPHYDPAPNSMHPAYDIYISLVYSFRLS